MELLDEFVKHKIYKYVFDFVLQELTTPKEYFKNIVLKELKWYKSILLMNDVMRLPYYFYNEVLSKIQPMAILNEVDKLRYENDTIYKFKRRVFGTYNYDTTINVGGLLVNYDMIRDTCLSLYRHKNHIENGKPSYSDYRSFYEDY